jgi:hypothetical protein
VIVAERLEPSKHGVNLDLLGDEGGKSPLLRLGDLLLHPEAHLQHSIDQLNGHMNALRPMEGKSKRRSESEI